MNNIEEIVTAYLDDTLADYAIMIDGAWGSGKTYHWKTVIAPLIAMRKGTKPETKQRPIYVSLYGLTTPEDIDRAIFLALHPILGSKASKVVNAVGRVMLAPGVGVVSNRFLGFAPDLTGTKLKVGDWLTLDNVVLCFDDLERSSISISDMMGYINQYVEHKRVKTIILCHEGALEMREKDAYTKIKEKLVGRTIKFRPDHGGVVDSLIGLLSKDSSYQHFLERNRGQIVQIFQKSGLDNVRVLMQGLSELRTIFSVINSRFPDRPELVERFISLVLSLTFEFRCNRATAEQVNDITLKGRAFSYVAALAKNGEKSYVDQYVDRYFDGNYQGVVTSPAIGDFIISGQLEDARLFEELEWLTDIKDEFQKAAELLFNQNPFDRLSEPDDDQFQRASRVILDCAKNGEIRSLSSLYQIYGYAMNWAHQGLVVETPGEMQELMSSALSKSLANGWLKFQENLEDAMHLFDNGGDPDWKAYCDLLLKVNGQLEKKRNESEASELLDCLRNRPEEARTKLYKEWKSIPILGSIPPHELADAIKKMPNGMKESIRYAIMNRYKYGGPRLLSQEADVLRLTMQLLDEWVKANSDRPRVRSVVLIERAVKEIQNIFLQYGSQSHAAS